jgi:hypothetical protein
MKPTYEIIESSLMGIESKVLKKTDIDGTVSWIPIDEANPDYQAYLNAKAEQSTPIVIDETETK